MGAETQKLFLSQDVRVGREKVEESRFGVAHKMMSGPLDEKSLTDDGKSHQVGRNIFHMM